MPRFWAFAKVLLRDDVGQAAHGEQPGELIRVGEATSTRPWRFVPAVEEDAIGIDLEPAFDVLENVHVVVLFLGRVAVSAFDAFVQSRATMMKPCWAARACQHRQNVRRFAAMQHDEHRMHAR